MKLSTRSWMATAAILWGVYLFLVPIFAMVNIKILFIRGDSLKVLTHFYPEMAPTIVGAFYGLAYGLICGAFCGWLFTSLHNRFFKFFKK